MTQLYNSLCHVGKHTKMFFCDEDDKVPVENKVLIVNHNAALGNKLAKEISLSALLKTAKETKTFILIVDPKNECFIEFRPYKTGGKYIMDKGFEKIKTPLRNEVLQFLGLDKRVPIYA